MSSSRGKVIIKGRLLLILKFMNLSKGTFLLIYYKSSGKEKPNQDSSPWNPLSFSDSDAAVDGGVILSTVLVNDSDTIVNTKLKTKVAGIGPLSLSLTVLLLFFFFESSSFPVSNLFFV